MVRMFLIRIFDYDFPSEAICDNFACEKFMDGFENLVIDEYS